MSYAHTLTHTLAYIHTCAVLFFTTQYRSHNLKVRKEQNQEEQNSTPLHWQWSWHGRTETRIFIVSTPAAYTPGIAETPTQAALNARWCPEGLERPRRAQDWCVSSDIIRQHPGLNAQNPFLWSSALAS